MEISSHRNTAVSPYHKNENKVAPVSDVKNSHNDFYSKNNQEFISRYPDLSTSEILEQIIAGQNFTKQTVVNIIGEIYSQNK